MDIFYQASVFCKPVQYKHGQHGDNWSWQLKDGICARGLAVLEESDWLERHCAD